jgi:hypothetical protein
MSNNSYTRAMQVYNKMKEESFKGFTPDYTETNLRSMYGFLITMSESELDSLTEMLDNMKRVKSKLTLSGIQLMIVPRLIKPVNKRKEKIIPYIFNIKSTSNSPFTFKCSSINNGDIYIECRGNGRFSTDNNITVDLSGINFFNIKSQYISTITYNLSNKFYTDKDSKSMIISGVNTGIEYNKDAILDIQSYENYIANRRKNPRDLIGSIILMYRLLKMRLCYNCTKTIPLQDDAYNLVNNMERISEYASLVGTKFSYEQLKKIKDLFNQIIISEIELDDNKTKLIFTKECEKSIHELAVLTEKIIEIALSHTKYNSDLITYEHYLSEYLVYEL